MSCRQNISKNNPTWILDLFSFLIALNNSLIAFQISNFRKQTCAKNSVFFGALAYILFSGLYGCLKVGERTIKSPWVFVCFLAGKWCCESALSADSAGAEKAPQKWCYKSTGMSDTLPAPIFQ